MQLRVGGILESRPYGLHRTGVGVCLNELECVAFASSRNFTLGSTPREGPGA